MEALLPRAGLGWSAPSRATPTKRRFADNCVPKLELRHEGNGFAQGALECADWSALCGRRQLAAVGGVDRGVGGVGVRRGPAARTSPLLPQSADKSAQSKARGAREKRSGAFAPHSTHLLVTKLQLGHAIVLEALLPRAGIGRERPRSVHADEAELRRQVRSQAGAWERGGMASRPARPEATPLGLARFFRRTQGRRSCVAPTLG